MDFWTLLDTWWFRIITLPIDIVIFYYVSKWALKETLFYNQEQWETAERHEKKIISWFKVSLSRKKRGDLFIIELI